MHDPAKAHLIRLSRIVHAELQVVQSSKKSLFVIDEAPVENLFALSQDAYPLLAFVLSLLGKLPVLVQVAGTWIFNKIDGRINHWH